MENRRTLVEARDEFIKSQDEECTVDKAEQQIIAEFADGKRRAEGVLPGGIRSEPIPEALWLQAIKPAPHTGSEPDWIKGKPVVAVDFEAGTAIAHSGKGFVHIREILDMPATEDHAAPPQAATPPTRQTKNPGGRPTQYDWDRIHIEMIYIAHVSPDGLPDRPTVEKRLRDAMTEWGWEDQPSNSTLKAKLRRVYKDLPDLTE